jgi:GAF domain-containing protein
MSPDRTTADAHLAEVEAEQAALRRIAALLARSVPAGEVFDAVVAEVRSLMGVEAAVLGRYEADGATRLRLRHPRRPVEVSARARMEMAADRTRELCVPPSLNTPELMLPERTLSRSCSDAQPSGRWLGLICRHFALG